MAATYSRDSIVKFLAPAVQGHAGHTMVIRWAQALGFNRETFGLEEALKLLEVLAGQGGKVAAAARSARVQVILGASKPTRNQVTR